MTKGSIVDPVLANNHSNANQITGLVAYLVSTLPAIETTRESKND